MTKKKIAICGGGIIGCATAYYLSLLDKEKTLDISLIERESVACHSSGKAGGFLALDWNDHSPVGELARFSYSLHKELSTTLGKDIGYRCLDTFSVSVKTNTTSDKNGNKGKDHWVGNGRKDRIGSVSSTAQVHPYILTKALLAASEGVNFIKGTVKAIEKNSENKLIKIILEDGKTLEPDVTILALGAWTSTLKNFFDLCKPVFDVSGSKVHSIVVEAPNTPPEAIFAYLVNKQGQSKEPELYPRPDGTVYICGEGDKTPLPDNPTDITPSNQACQNLYDMSGKICSSLEDSKLLTKQACYIPSSPDGIPIIGEVPYYPRTFIASGHGVWGILNGPATGKCLAQLVLGLTSDINLQPFSPNRLL